MTTRTVSTKRILPSTSYAARGTLLVLALLGTCAGSAREPTSGAMQKPPWTPPPVAALPRGAPEHPIDLMTLTLRNPERAARRVLVDTGVPLPEGLELLSTSALGVRSAEGSWAPVQLEPRMRWGGVPVEDGSAPLRWVGLRFEAELPAKSTTVYTLVYGGKQPAPANAVRVEQSGERLVVETGAARFVLKRGGPDLFEEASLTGTTGSGSAGATGAGSAGASLLGAGNGLFVTDRQGKRYRVAWQGEGLQVEARGPLEAVISLQGALQPEGEGARPWLESVLRMHFRAGATGVELEHTLRNPEAAVHPGNVWTLGGAGSAFLGSVALELPVRGEGARYALSAEGDAPLTGPLSGTGEISLVQDSSGGKAWRSRRHVDARGRLPERFRGYEVKRGGTEGADQKGSSEKSQATRLRHGDHARPALSVVTGQGGVTVALEDFWQNFPKGVAAKAGRAVLYLFPPSPGAPVELQGGEQKTDRFAFWLEPPGQDPAPQARLNELSRVYPELPADVWLAARATFQQDRPRGKLYPGTIETTMETAVHPAGTVWKTMATVADQRDAYGWRDYGDVQADHETECGKPAGPDFISHYNNQYDYVLGAFHQFGRTGDQDWLEFALRTASHTADIDIYHTRKDRVAYNGGMFWHTTHDSPAGTSSHRSYPALADSSKCTEYTSGGPGLGHLYAEGLVVAWLLTGEPRFRDAALELGEFALGRRSIDKREADGRSLGNYLRTLVTLCELTGNARYCGAADEILPAVDSELKAGAPDWGRAMAAKALGRWLELDDQRARRHGGEGAGPSAGQARAVALSALLGFCQRVMATELPLDVNRARFADVLAYGYRYGRDDPRASEWLRGARHLQQSLDEEYWGRGTYPNAKELSVLLSNGGDARSVSVGPRGTAWGG